MIKSALIGAATAFASAVAVVPALAFTAPVSFTEDAVSGIVVDYPTSAPPIVLGSDGESLFDPFGAGYDTSDAIQLNGNWRQVGGFDSWVNIGNDTYVIPACLGGVCENGAVPEEVGVWLFAGTSWLDITPAAVYLWEADGTISDIVKVWNTPDGAWISFNSSVPEPSTWAMLVIGFAGLGFAGYRARNRTAAALSL